MKNDKKIFILIETILAVLALIVALFMIEEWADTEVRKISVVVQDSDGSRWAAFKYGLRWRRQITMWRYLWSAPAGR